LAKRISYFIGWECPKQEAVKKALTWLVQNFFSLETCMTSDMQTQVAGIKETGVTSVSWPSRYANGSVKL
jgi:hypothetical protein